MNKKLDEKEENFKGWGNGILLGIIGSVAGSFFVGYFQKFTDGQHSFLNIFFLILSFLFLVIIFQIFECRLKNYKSQALMDDKEYNSSMNTCLFNRFKKLFKWKRNKYREVAINLFIIFAAMFGVAVLWIHMLAWLVLD